MSIVSVSRPSKRMHPKPSLLILLVSRHDVSLLKQAFANVLVMGHYETALDGLQEFSVQGFLS